MKLRAKLKHSVRRVKPVKGLPTPSHATRRARARINVAQARQRSGRAQ